MSAKKKSLVYRCSNCGHNEPKWLGRCPECGQWNTLRETAAGLAREDVGGETFSLPIVSIDPGEAVRVSTGSSEVDRVLGGGLMRGSAVLLGGEPGIGKSTLLLQVCARADTKGRVLYVSGEESPAQIRLRAERLGALRDTLEVFCSGDLSLVRSVLDAVKPSIAVIDSIQTLHAEEAGAVPGTANQIKYCAQELSSWAKSHDAALILVAHVTKEGLIAGPKAAEHLVDAVLGFEQGDGDTRVLRASKNRFGSAEEVGLFRMGESGLVEVTDPSEMFMVRRGAVGDSKATMPVGAAVALVHEGSRALLVEIQALTVPAKAGLTRVYSERIDAARVSRVAAVLEKHAGARFSDQDLYVNVAGGMRLVEPGIDLALASALYSARSGLGLPGGAALVGELSLAGELRPVRQMRKRARAAVSLGFTTIIGPSNDFENGRSEEGKGTAEWTGVADLKAALRLLFGSKAASS
ncbi:MAG TPA: DNA repair protein RadA [Rectinemataceae bacterium]|nr:DNA repair protein RadA [Rectinemataceae bacterium]